MNHENKIYLEHSLAETVNPIGGMNNEITFFNNAT